MSDFFLQSDRAFPLVMGILNVTPDSFSDGGLFEQKEASLKHVRDMIDAGVDIIDIGGESTRPGAKAVSVAEELQRVIPVIEAIRTETDIPVSIDTSKAQVMREAVVAGASVINDVRALQEEGALQAAAELPVPVVLMHMQGQPRTMQEHPEYNNVVEDVCEFLRNRVQACEQAGISRDRLIVDPGFGFGKTLQHNLSLFRHIPELKQQLDLPVLIGVSRKSMIGAVLDIPVEERMPASVALAGLAAWMGADIIRAHDVRETCQAVKMCGSVKESE
ncbi:MAG: dihydropteroate synthase [Gammaproteobacteria bacterium]|nr:dihydropteroate synthase [Gammaproteobacteria bacterium]